MLGVTKTTTAHTPPYRACVLSVVTKSVRRLLTKQEQNMASRRDPSAEEIAAICLEIQSEWTPAERMKRLRPDLRPHYTRCDGVEEDIDADDYDDHHSERERLQAMAGANGSRLEPSIDCDRKSPVFTNTQFIASR